MPASSTRCAIASTCSPARRASGPTTAVPNAVALPPAIATAPSAPPVVVMTGNFTYRPNIDGLRWFEQAVWPIVDARCDADLVVVGPGSDTVSDHGIGVVADLGGLLSTTSVMVVPLLHGSGTRVKALDGMAHGLPLVGTSLGLEGLGLRDGRDCLVADRPTDFADAVVGLIGDPARRRALGAAGRAVVEERYAVPVVASDVAGMLGHLLEGPTTTRRLRLVDGLSFPETDGDLLVRVDGSGVVHRLNDTAAAVLALVDGSSTRQEMVATLIDAVGLAPSVAEVAVRDGLDRLREAGLVIDAVGPPHRRL